MKRVKKRGKKKDNRALAALETTASLQSMHVSSSVDFRTFPPSNSSVKHAFIPGKPFSAIDVYKAEIEGRKKKKDGAKR